ncbi:galactokinase-like [Anthonomus grandis grandis]|uniref:galactokinase-like n=1 Tax=Anthonomus grandis grandis TaxID=2921223 RepID=UPI002166715C|nr:galactokinase-like [Anthonomus grandis grandis]
MAEPIPTIESLLEHAKSVFREEFDSDADVAVAAPGRVNLIGEHTDYNDGFVMPMALPLVTIIVGRKVAGDVATIVTTNKDVDDPKKITVEMPNRNALVRTLEHSGPKWCLYVKGVIANYAGPCPPAFEAVVHTSVPTGGGLSSSAALEVATYTFLDALTGGNPQESLNDKALACQKAEHQYAGMPCGIMDQFISCMGQEGNALLIDCRHMTSQLVPLDDPQIVVLVTNSNVKHELTGSEYPTRRRHCQEAALILKKVSLRDANESDIDYLKSIETDETLLNRARHVITEIERTVQGAKALKEHNYQKFGQLMVESHNSLRDDYAVSCPELDSLVRLALEVDGTLGSRMTGGGFGGCTVTLVYANAVDKVIQHIRKNYKGTPTFYVCKPSPGARILQRPT